MIPVGSETVECEGVCTVLFDECGLIRQNEVFFDRTELLAQISASSS